MRKNSELTRRAMAGLLLLASAAAAAQQRAPSAPTQHDMMYPPPRGQATRYGVSFDVSALLGIGASLGVPMRNNSNLRLAYHGLSYGYDFEDESARYDAQLRLRNVALFTDWFPRNGAYRVTSGLMLNGNRATLAGRDDGGRYTVGDCSYQSSSSDPLRVDGRVEFERFAPYLGIGWGGNLHASPGFFGTLDIGAMYAGRADVSLAASGTATPVAGSPPQCGTGPQDAAQSAEVQQQLREAEAKAEAEAKDYKFWPHIALGIGWRF